MRKVSVFNHVSLDGYFTDKNNDMSWAHTSNDAEWDKFAAENAKGGGVLMFGRITYEMMASYWPTPAAAKQAPDVAKGMNDLPKVQQLEQLFPNMYRDRPVTVYASSAGR